MTWSSVRRYRMAALGATLCLTVAILFAIKGPANPAAGTLGDLTCTLGNGNVTFSPGINFTSHSTNFTIDGTLGTCASSQPGITGGSYVVNGTGEGSCIMGGTGTGTGTVTFNDPAHSTSAFTVKVSLGYVAGIPTMNGSASLTGPAFTGRMATAIPLTASFDPTSCSSPSGMTLFSYYLATTLAG